MPVCDCLARDNGIALHMPSVDFSYTSYDGFYIEINGRTVIVFLVLCCSHSFKNTYPVLVTSNHCSLQKMKDEHVKREAAMFARRREEMDALKLERKERLKTSVTASFSGKQKKEQLRARKQRLASRRNEMEALDLEKVQYEDFYADKSSLIEENGVGANAEAFSAEASNFTRNNDLENNFNSRLKLTVALGKNNIDAVGKELSSFFVKESKEQIQLRIMEGQRPLDLAKRETPLLASICDKDPILDHPKRPKWTYKMSKGKVDNNESIMFDEWLTKIHDKYNNEHLNHFEHNLEVWRQLWRVTERATHIVVVADVRNPLLHIPASVYDLVTNELNKPIVVVLNKIDLIPTAVVELWQQFLVTQFPKAVFVCFSSRCNAVHGNSDVSTRRRVLSKKLEVGNAMTMKGAVDILVACDIDATEAQQLVEELNDSSIEQESLYPEMTQNEKNTNGRRRSRRKRNNQCVVARRDESLITIKVCQHCGCNDAVVACMSCASMSCASGSRISSADANVANEAEAIARGYLLCTRCDEEEHAEMRGHFQVRLQSALAAELKESSTFGSVGATGQTRAPKVTIGLIGHPNVGKSSVLNALAGKKIVSVSHTPGHTKHLQTIMISPEICLCDCPGLVFPFAGVPKHLQELSGLYPYSQIREPYSAVRFLAEHVMLEKILNLKPRTQLFDNLHEELVRKFF